MVFENVAVVGMHFRAPGAKEIAASLQPGATVHLEAEPDNPFDANALAVYVEDFHIGYVEKEKAAWIAPALSEGAPFTATVTGQEERKRNVHPLLCIKVGPEASSKESGLDYGGPEEDGGYSSPDDISGMLPR